METPELNIEEQLKCYRLLLEERYEMVEWHNVRGWRTCTESSLLKTGLGTVRKYANNVLRLKPQPKYRPWKVEEVPLGAWIKIDAIRVGIICGADANQLFIGFKCVSYDTAFNCGKCSQDQGKTWSVCGVIE